jgi:hypothetical protein
MTGIDRWGKRLNIGQVCRGGPMKAQRSKLARLGLCPPVICCVLGIREISEVLRWSGERQLHGGRRSKSLGQGTQG